MAEANLAPDGPAHTCLRALSTDVRHRKIYGTYLRSFVSPLVFEILVTGLQKDCNWTGLMTAKDQTTVQSFDF